jgi:hypothetical protein
MCCPSFSLRVPHFAFLGWGKRQFNLSMHVNLYTMSGGMNWAGNSGETGKKVELWSHVQLSLICSWNYCIWFSPQTCSPSGPLASMRTRQAAFLFQKLVTAPISHGFGVRVVRAVWPVPVAFSIRLQVPRPPLSRLSFQRSIRSCGFSKRATTFGVAHKLNWLARELTEKPACRVLSLHQAQPRQDADQPRPTPVTQLTG